MSFIDEYGTERPRIRVQADYGQDVPPLGRKLLDAISGGESSGYNVMYGGGTFNDYRDHPRQAVPITTGPNAGQTSSAAGKYQFLGSTWDEVAKEAGLKDFSPRNQDFGAWHLAQKTYKSKTGRDLLADLESGKGDPNTINTIGKSLSGVWTSLPGGIEPNRATDSFASRFGAGGDPGARPQPTSLSFVSSAQAAPRPTSGLFDDVLGETPAPAAAAKTTSGLFDDVLGAEPIPIDRRPIQTTGFQPSGDIENLKRELRRSADEKLAGVAGGGAQGALGTFGSQLANTALFNLPRNAMAAIVAQQHDIPFDQAYQMLKDIDAAGDRLNPKSSWGGFGTGIVAGAAAPALSAARAIGPAERALTAGLTAGGYSAISEFFDSKDPQKTAIAGALGVALGTVAAPVAGKIVDLVSSFVKRGKTGTTFLKPDGTLTDEAAAAAREAGIDPADLTKVMQAKYAETFAQKGATPAAAREAAAAEFNIPLTQGQATATPSQIRTEDMMARGAYGAPAQQIASEARGGQFGAIREAGSDINQQLARGQPVAANTGEAGALINAELAEKARQGQQVVTASERAAQTEEAALRAKAVEQQKTLDQFFPDVPPPREAAAQVGETIRDAAAASKATYKSQWEGALGREGEFSDLAFRDIGERIRREVTAKTGLEVTPELTPSAYGALVALDRKLAELRFQNRALPRDAESRTAGFIRHPGEPLRMGGEVQEGGQVVGVTLRGMDTARKILGQYFAKALSSGDKTDIRATRQIMDAFINDVETSISTGLFKGDERAWPALKEAIQSFRQHQQSFSPQYNDGGVGRAMKQIIEQKATPEEIANMIFGYSKAGEKGLPVRMAEHLEKVLGRDSDAWLAIKDGLWTKVSQSRSATGEINPSKSAQSILDFSQSTLAKRVFFAEEISAMQAHANNIKTLEGSIKGLEASIKGSPSTQQAEAARSGYAQVFGGENIGGAPATVFRNIVAGRATPEEIAGVVFNAISADNPGNVVRMINAIEGIAGKDSAAMAAIRQGVWQRITTNAPGKDQPGSQKIAQNVSELLNGKGASIAGKLYSPEELGLMRRYAAAVKMTTIPPDARTGSDTTPAMMAMARQYGGMVFNALTSVANKATGGTGGAVFDILTRNTLKARKDAADAKRATQAFTGGAPVAVPPRPPVTDRTAVTTGAGIGLATGQAIQ